ncbi:probable NIC96-Nuclear pore protein [Zygosaccharomyces bailii ISA1307]|uniref:Nuclear pore protein n=1 Tax=Zygosaccharomyces bailii (strain CLIB 213 / ATCC 58445 / CBS 680 / BCRC 21525 / NBRC 1098 / NCYC 1416 / NRRL Y-2227) TaxID=1333698 RepID=A0A8J2TAJ6_ZYGB2|nr:ZYBA0S09-01046g1_1 [Zygosaccharomyces bailii CLIB 213]CDH13962.1 probable NIC96-Nuclear pore protein [Zygosaccharomyces bailii ISA1307]
MSLKVDPRSSKKDHSPDVTLKGSAKLLSELVETSKNLPTTSSELGSIQLSVNEIRKRVHDLRRGKDIGTDHTKAHYLLAGSGLPIEDVDLSLKTLQSKQLLEQSVPKRQVEGEIETYLEAKKDENILSSIEQLLSLAAKDFDNFVNQNLSLDWAQRKEEVRENFGILVQKKNYNDFTKHLAPMNPKLPTWGNQGSSILNSGETRLNVNENYAVREKFEKYAKIIYRFNNTRQMKQDFPLLKELSNALSTGGDLKNRQLLESCKILEGLKHSTDVVTNAKTYLQDQFLEYVDHLYKRNLNEGLPTNINKIKSFIDCKLKNPNNTWKFNNLTFINGTPIWALIFYLLRAGLLQEALEVAINNKASFKKVEQSFLTYLKAYVSSKDHKMPVEFSAKLHTEYSQHIKSSLDGDPFRLAVYKIIGRCDLTRKNISFITLSVEDWLWIHFMLIKDDIADTDPVYERYSLSDFQNIITSYGATRFTNYYLQVLILSGLYELAIEYAYSMSEIDAVHLAIAMANQKLLKVSNDNSLKQGTDFVFMKDNERRINFAKVLGNYTKSFKYSDPRIAAEYLILIALVDTSEQVEMCHQALRELVLETKEFTILLGKINRDGTRIPGVLEERQSLLHLKDEKEFLRKITEHAAVRADEDGRVYDCLLLYQLSEEYNIVVMIVNGLLSDLLANTDLEQPLVMIDENNETNPILIAKKIVSIYIENLEISKKVQSKNKETCILLLKLADARRAYLVKQWETTLAQIEELDLLPFSDEISARKKAQDFPALNENIIKIIPNLLVMVMSCISQMIKSLNQSDYKSSAKGQQVDALKNVSRNCMMYAGMIQYKMPRETYSALIRLDIV